MLGTDVTLDTVASIPAEYRKKLTDKLPKAFEKLDMDWYSPANRIVGKTVLSGKIVKAESRFTEKDLKAEETLATFKREAIHAVVLLETADEVKAMLGKLLKAVRTETAGKTWSLTGSMFGFSFEIFDKLAHLTDILFAALNLVEDGHKARLELTSA